MSLFEWSPIYSVGVQRFDQQHQRLFALINHLHDSVRMGQEQAIVQEVLHELIKYAEDHFAAEEVSMHRLGYPDLAAHKAEHDKFRKQVAAFWARQKDGEAELGMTMVNFLLSWLTLHIMKTDREYSPFFAAHSPDLHTKSAKA